MFTVFYFAIDADIFQNVCVLMAFYAACYFLLPIINRWTTTSRALWIAIILGFLQIGSISVILGTAAGNQFFFLAVPLGIALVADDDYRTILVTGFAALVSFAILNNANISGLIEHLPSALQQAFQTANALAAFLMTFGFGYYFHRVMRRSELELNRANELSENLL